jgi:hypothetical protein
MRAHVIALGFALVLGCSTVAMASPIQLSYSGSVIGCSTFDPYACVSPGGQILLALYPPGTPISFLIDVDTVATNYAANPAVSGYYQFPGGQVTIGGQTYGSGFWAWEVNCPLGSCASGPGVQQAFNPVSGDIRVVAIHNAPFFFATLHGNDSLGYVALCCDLYLAGGFRVTATPEPSTWLLLGSGLAAVLARRFRGRP